ncbi:MAG: hypothetical protein RJA50_620, partial [Actinomycetota bacterium]
RDLLLGRADLDLGTFAINQQYQWRLATSGIT